MAFAKTEQFPEAVVQMADFARALAHPARIALLKQLLESPGCCCADLEVALKLSQPSCSRHLAVLRKADLVTPTQRGNEIIYQLKSDRIKLFCNAFRESLNP